MGLVPLLLGVRLFFLLSPPLLCCSSAAWGRFFPGDQESPTLFSKALTTQALPSGA